MRSNPFFDDPFFQEFFGYRRGQPRTQKRTGLGTGFVISDDGYICTNHHVVQNVDKVTVKIDEKSYDAEVIASDKLTDIALIKIKSDHKLSPVYLGNSDEVRVGDWAIAIGNPFGLDRTFTVGVISATAREDVDMSGSPLSHIQTDASINPGNSGGPLINLDGEVIGVNRMITSPSGGNIGIGFAIPINTVKTVIEDLKKYKKVKRGYMGVYLSSITDEYAEELGLKTKKGALIIGVVENSPAEKGGIKIGDVIVEFDGKEIEKDTDLVKIVSSMPIGKSVKVTVIREKKRVNLYVKLQEMTDTK